MVHRVYTKHLLHMCTAGEFHSINSLSESRTHADSVYSPEYEPRVVYSKNFFISYVNDIHKISNNIYIDFQISFWFIDDTLNSDTTFYPIWIQPCDVTVSASIIVKRETTIQKTYVWWYSTVPYGTYLCTELLCFDSIELKRAAFLAYFRSQWILFVYTTTAYTAYGPCQCSFPQ